MRESSNLIGTQRAQSRGAAPESPLALTDPAVPIVTANVTCATGADALMAPSSSRWRVRLARSIRELGSYGAMALIFPGGNLISLALWMLQNRTWLAARALRGLSALWTAAVRLIFPR
jgi:hypothetical protein